ncbi:exo-beta-N-acetylmuramidase NamZ domain-containing protein [Cloacibacterium normanense]|uniref:exo-beta-N-acetylmuramidase NamZ family protein n=1 Tax=Cloacibacterium normanense TaxID=237258 RepID=UPI0035B3DC2F
MNLSVKIKDLVLIMLMIFGLQSCSTQKNNANPTPEPVKTVEIALEKPKNKEENCFKNAADRPELYLPLLKNKTVAIVANQTSLLADKTHLVDFLVQNNIKIKHIFAPEHGFRGTADAGEHVKNGIDTKTGLPIISLYGDNKKPKSEQLQGVDIVLFDIQDVGVRFYTYISTLTYVMEAAAENGKEIIVLDRPNPHDGYTDGPVLKEKWTSFVGLHKVPVVYGLTIGEYGKMVNGEKWMKNAVQVKYTLIPMLNYHKNKRYPISEKPSPNLPNDQSINLYPSLCFFEGTQVSVGRGTDFPFQVYGSPWLKNQEFSFTPKPTSGAKDPFLNGKICFGKDLRQFPEIKGKLDLSFVIDAYQNFDKKAQDFFLKNLWFDTLAGTDELRKQIISETPEAEIRKSWQKDLENFEKIRRKYVLYEN